MENFRYIKVEMIAYQTSTYPLPSFNSYQFIHQTVNASSFLLRGSHKIHLFPSGSAQLGHWRHVLIAFFQIKMMVSSLPSTTRPKLYCWSECSTSWDMLHPLSVHHNQLQRWDRSSSWDGTSQALDNCRSSLTLSVSRFPKRAAEKNSFTGAQRSIPQPWFSLSIQAPWALSFCLYTGHGP